MSSRRHLIAGFVALLSGLGSQACFGAGASVNFTTYEAEAGTRGGGATLVTLAANPSSTHSSPEYEASGRQFVLLDATGEYVQWNSVVASNKMTIRFCTPDSSGGGGATSSLALYVAGTFRANISLSSKYAWLYGTAGDNGQSNTPSAGTAHVFWDDFRLSIPGNAITSGQSVKLQKDSGNTAAFYRIDLIDLETGEAAPPTPAAGTYLDVTAAPYNAVPDDGANDSTAFQNCINAAAAANPKKIVWVPSGVYNLSTKVEIKGVEVRGRNHWNTRIAVASGVRGFKLNNSGAKLTYVGLFNETATNRSTTTYGIEGSPGTLTNWAVQRCWIQHTGAGMWMSGSNGGNVSNNRVYNTYADGINLNSGSSNNTVTQNYVRGTGDDGIAMISETLSGTISSNNTATFNTVRAVWWGSNMSLRGGGGHVIEDNYLADSTAHPGLTLNLESAYDMYPITGATFRRNRLDRCGGNRAGQKRGAIFVYTGNKAIAGVAFTDTTINNPIFKCALFKGNSMLNQTTTFTNTTMVMSNSAEYAVLATDSGLAGSSTFTNGSVTGSFAGKFQDNAANFTLSNSGF